MEQETKPTELSVIVAAEGTYVLLRGGKRVCATAGEALFMRIQPGAEFPEHAWTMDDGKRRALAQYEVSEEILGRLLPKLREFINEAVKRLPQWDDGQRSKIEVELGGVGYDDDDRPQFDIRVESTHQESV